MTAAPGAGGGVPGRTLAAVRILLRVLPLLPVSVFASDGTVDFSGTWETTYGRLVLIQDGSDVSGWYTLNGLCMVEGTVDSGGRLEFRYEEPSASGSGWFELSRGGAGIAGEWREDGSSEWFGWEGYRVEPSSSDGEVPADRWLVVLEAEWQDGMEEEDFSFGEMLDAWFERVPGVEVRQRFVHDAEDVARFCFEAACLPGTVYLVLASHGSNEGLELPGGVMDPAELVEALEPLAGSLAMLHFSSCEVMAGRCPEAVLRDVSWTWRDGFVVSGYDREVDWYVSALIEILYYDLILEHGLEPAAAAEAVLSGLPFAGSSGRGCFEPAGFTWMSPGGTGPAADGRTRRSKGWGRVGNRSTGRGAGPPRNHQEG